MSDLKYLFEAEFEDGSVILQTPEDRSKLDPLRSEFYDVCEKEKESRLMRFALTGAGTYLLVDLLDGHFELNGVRFEAHETMPEDKTVRRLIFYRKHDANTNVVLRGNEVQKILGMEDKIIGYCIGWQARIEDGSVDGRNYKETITLN